MQSVLFYGRILSRAIAKGIYDVSSCSGSPTSSAQQQSSNPSAPSASTGYSTQESLNKVATDRNFRFLTAVSGFPKNSLVDKVKPGKFGDDAYFVAKHTTGEVIGKKNFSRPSHIISSLVKIW